MRTSSTSRRGSRPLAGAGQPRRWIPWPYLLFVGLTLGRLPLRSNEVVSSVSFTLIFMLTVIVGVVYSVKAARHKQLSREVRRPWRYLAVSFVLTLIAGAGIAIGMGTDPSHAEMSAPLAIGVAARVGQVVLVLMAMLSFAATPLDGRARRKLVTDLVIVVGGASMVLWYLLIGPALAGERTRSSPAMIFYSVIMVLCSLATLVGICTVLLRGTLAPVRRPVAVLLTGVGAYLLTDLVFISMQLHGQVLVRSVPADLALIVPLFLMVAAPVEQCRRTGSDPVDAPTKRGVQAPNSLPYVALAVGYGVLVVAAFKAGIYPWIGLVGGGLIMTAGVAIRQHTALRENYALAVTDTLTGIANRAQMTSALTQALGNSRRTGKPMSVLTLDLDGFKNVNDSYGHAAGDELLIAFADVLRHTVRRGDTVARPGGDEFAVVLDATDDATAVTVAERILAELRKPVIVGGHPLTIRSSIGIAATDPAHGPVTVDDLLHRADLAMYTAKRQRAHGWQLYNDTMMSESAGGDLPPNSLAPSTLAQGHCVVV